MQPKTKTLIRTISIIDQTIPDSSKGLRTLYNNLNRVLESLLEGDKKKARRHMRALHAKLESPAPDVDQEIMAMFKNDTIPLVDWLVEDEE